MFLAKNYNKDDDIELLKLFAMIADVNNPEIENATETDSFLADIRQEAIRFSLDKEVQPMLISEEMEIWDQTVGKALERATSRAEGHEEGQSNTIDLFSWLFKSGRTEDAIKAADDRDFFNKLLVEYQERTN